MSKNASSHPRVHKLSEAEISDIPFLDLLKVSSVEVNEGVSHFTLTVQQRHLRTLGIIHGGVVATLLDSALGVAAGSLAPPEHDVVTAQLNINFIRPAWEGEVLTTTGEVRHAGQLTAVSRGEIWTDRKVLVASATGTFIFIPHAQVGREKFEKRPDRVRHDVEPPTE